MRKTIPASQFVDLGRSVQYLSSPLACMTSGYAQTAGTFLSQLSSCDLPITRNVAAPFDVMTIAARSFRRGRFGFRTALLICGAAGAICGRVKAGLGIGIAIAFALLWVVLCLMQLGAIDDGWPNGGHSPPATRSSR
jgi:hypothetical protein